MSEHVPSVVGDPLTDRLLMRLCQVRRMFELMFKDNLDLRSAVKLNDPTKFDEQQGTDAVYLLKRLVETIEDIRKECNLTIGMIENYVGIIWGFKMQTGQTDKASIHGRVALGVPDTKTVTVVPPKDSAEYVMLMHHLGVTDEMLQHDSLHIHWPGLCDYLEKLNRSGKPLPPGIDAKKTHPRNTLTARVRPGLSFDDLLMEMNRKRTQNGKDANNPEGAGSAR